MPQTLRGCHGTLLSTMHDFPFYFFVHKTFVCIHCVSVSPTVTVAFVYTIDPKGSDSMEKYWSLGFLTVQGVPVECAHFWKGQTVLC